MSPATQGDVLGYVASDDTAPSPARFSNENKSDPASAGGGWVAAQTTGKDSGEASGRRGARGSTGNPASGYSGDAGDVLPGDTPSSHLASLPRSNSPARGQVCHLSCWPEKGPPHSNPRLLRPLQRKPRLQMRLSRRRDHRSQRQPLCTPDAPPRPPGPAPSGPLSRETPPTRVAQALAAPGTWPPCPQTWAGAKTTQEKRPVF